MPVVTFSVELTAKFKEADVFSSAAISAVLNAKESEDEKVEIPRND